MARFSDQLAEARCLPPMIICDNGPEFTSKAMVLWSKQRKAKLGFMQLGKPTQNTFVGSLNGRFRNECLKQRWFRSLEEAL